MRTIAVAPKATSLLVARLGSEPAYNVDVFENQDELTALCGVGEDGQPKLTVLGMAQELFVTRVQTVVSKELKASAVFVKDAAGQDTADYASNQEVSDEVLAGILIKSYPEAIRLLVGERAEGAGRQSQKAKYEAQEAARRAEQIDAMRQQFAVAPNKAARQMFLQLADSFKFAELANEFRAALG
jgi:hypothetical protein